MADKEEYDFNPRDGFDIAVECTGGKLSESADNQAIDILNPGGHIIMMGVSDREFAFGLPHRGWKKVLLEFQWQRRTYSNITR
ncbi:hypothetical protein [Paenibacillus alkalitolerans]|uniref:hypothetical protein n=1 Tax=Paenibacillus alkalitolerans TaxID=2799335 RepID=UPI0018F783EA|nr:hypothetical protein [Paenibacillus alkalitolerans]